MYDELVKALRDMSKMGMKYGMAVVKMREAADAIEELSADLERSKEWEAFWEKEANEALKKFQTAVARMPRWIPVTERLPSAHELVLIYNPGYLMTTGFIYEDGRWRVRSVDYPDTPTHWMPLPEPPKEE
jgi:hypothetical protein